MKESNKKPQPAPATLTLDAIGDFAEHAHEINAHRVYLTANNQGDGDKLIPIGEGGFLIIVTARTDTTVLQYQESVRDVSHIDAYVRPEDAERRIAERLEEVAAHLRATGFTVKRGRWTN